MAASTEVEDVIDIKSRRHRRQANAESTALGLEVDVEEWPFNDVTVYY